MELQPSQGCDTHQVGSRTWEKMMDASKTGGKCNALASLSFHC